MRKVELLEVERAALIGLVDNEIDFGDTMISVAKKDIRNPLNENAEKDGWTQYGYWIERLYMLRQLKAKLEREEE